MTRVRVDYRRKLLNLLKCRYIYLHSIVSMHSMTCLCREVELHLVAEAPHYTVECWTRENSHWDHKDILQNTRSPTHTLILVAMPTSRTHHHPVMSEEATSDITHPMPRTRGRRRLRQSTIHSHLCLQLSLPLLHSPEARPHPTHHILPLLTITDLSTSTL